MADKNLDNGKPEGKNIQRKDTEKNFKEPQNINLDVGTNSGNIQTVASGGDSYVAAGDINQLILNIINPHFKGRALNRRDKGKILYLNMFLFAILALMWVLGFWEILELKHYDILLKTRPGSDLDERIKLVSATEEDFKHQDSSLRSGGLGSIDDKTLVKVLNKVLAQNPKVIGLAIYRPYLEEQDPVAQIIKDNPNVVGIYELENYETTGIDIPDWGKELQARFGFSNVQVDYDGVVRRHLLEFQQPSGTEASSRFSFPLLLALHYYQEDSNEQKVDTLLENEHASTLLQKIVGKRVSPFYGAYQGLDSSGLQVLINYRTTKPRSPGPVQHHFNFQQIINDHLPPKTFTNKIVIIGVASKTVAPDFETPFGKTIPGFWLHAHVVNSLFDFYEESESRVMHGGIRVTSQFYILILSVLGGAIISAFLLQEKSVRFIITLCLTISIGFFIASWLAMGLFNLWIPILLPVLTIFTTSLSSLIASTVIKSIPSRAD